MAANALELACGGLPRPPFYVAGQVGGQGFSLHAEGQRVILTDATGQRKEVELAAPPATAALPEAVSPTANLDDGPAGEDVEPGPGESGLDEQMERLRRQGLLEEDEQPGGPRRLGPPYQEGGAT